MKANVEAWQYGNEMGFDDGFWGKPCQTTFNYPIDWKYSERVNHQKGYDDGYKQGQEDRKNNP